MEKTYTGKMAFEGVQEGDEGTTDQYIIAHYGLNVNLRGPALDAAVDMTQKQQNADFKSEEERNGR